MKCLHCGIDNPDNTKFCSNCGAPLNTYQQPQQPQPQQQNQQYYSQQFQQPPYQQPQQPIIIKEKKKIGCFTIGLIVLGVFFLLGLIGMILGNSEDSKSNNYSTSQITEKGSTKEKEIVKIEKQLLYDKNNVKIYVTGIEDNTVVFEFENNSKTNLRFESPKATVNGFSTGGLLSEAVECKVIANSKANGKFEIEKSFLNEYNIDTINTISLWFKVYDSDTLAAIKFITEQIDINTSSKEKQSRIVGENLYSKKGITIDYLERTDNTFKFIFTNDTGKVINDRLENVTINGYTFTTEYALDTDLNKSQSYFIISVDDEFIKDNSIKQIEKIEFNYTIWDDASDDSFDASYWSTERIALNVK